MLDLYERLRTHFSNIEGGIVNAGAAARSG